MPIESFTHPEKNQICIYLFIIRVVPVTIHAAVDKGCLYLNIECRKARLDSQYKVDIDHVESLTFYLVGCCNHFHRDVHAICFDFFNKLKL